MVKVYLNKELKKEGSYILSLPEDVFKRMMGKTFNALPNYYEVKIINRFYGEKEVIMFDDSLNILNTFHFF